jgi:hypothetical protein
MDSTNQRSVALIVAVVIFTVGMVASTFKVANSVIEVKGGNSITVTGSAKQQIKSDLIVWQGSYSRQASTMAEAYTLLNKDKDTVLKYLKEKKVDEKARTVSAVFSSPIYETTANGMTTNNIISYRLSQTVEIRSTEVDAITQLSRDVTDLLQQGIEFQSNPPQYYYTKIADLKVSMLAEATKDSKLRAEQISINTGSAIGKLKSAKMGVFQITPLYSTEISDYGINDTSSVDKEITAVVTCSFEVK